jgi:hypothetical protein
MQEAVKARRGAQARVKKTVPASRSHGTLTQARTEHHTTSHRTTTSRLLVAVRTPALALLRVFGFFSGRMPRIALAKFYG